MNSWRGLGGEPERTAPSLRSVGMTAHLPPLLLAALLLAGCERAGQRLDAAEDVRAFLLAVEARDRPAFDRHVDRAALKADINRQASARAADGEHAAALLATEQGQQLLDRLITPESFRLAVRSAPVLADRTPSAVELAAVLRPLSDDRVCLPAGTGDSPCAATFARQGGAWRLVGLNAGDIGLQSIPWPPSAAG